MTIEQELIDRLHYDPESGVLTWRRDVGRNREVRAGDIAGGPNGRGYIVVGYLGKRYMGHRLAWLLMTGAWPQRELDHINGDPLDNRIANLREATPSQNSANRRIPPKNTSGFKGVCWHKQCRKWQAAIRVGGKTHHLGLFEQPEDAHSAYVAAAAKHFGEFARAT